MSEKKEQSVIDVGEERDTEPTAIEVVDTDHPGDSEGYNQAVANIANTVSAKLGKDVSVHQVAPGVTVIGPAGQPVPGELNSILRSLGIKSREAQEADPCDVDPETGVCHNHGQPRMSRRAQTVNSYLENLQERLESLQGELAFLRDHDDLDAPPELFQQMEGLVQVQWQATVEAAKWLSDMRDAELAAAGIEAPPVNEGAN